MFVLILQLYIVPKGTKIRSGVDCYQYAVPDGTRYPDKIYCPVRDYMAVAHCLRHCFSVPLGTGYVQIGIKT